MRHAMPIACWTAALVLAAAPAAALAQTANLRGMITLHEGDKMTVKTSDGSEHVYTLTPDTKVTEVFGRFRLLIDRGLILRGRNNGGKKFFATTVEYHSFNRMNRRYGMCSGEAVADLPLKKTTSVTGNGLATRFWD